MFKRGWILLTEPTGMLEGVPFFITVAAQYLPVETTIDELFCL